MIAEDVRAALTHGRNPVVITERKEHLLWLENAFSDIKPLFVMRGGMRRKELLAIQQAFASSPFKNYLSIFAIFSIPDLL